MTHDTLQEQSSTKANMWMERGGQSGYAEILKKEIFV